MFVGVCVVGVCVCVGVCVGVFVCVGVCVLFSVISCSVLVLVGFVLGSVFVGVLF